MWAGGCPLQCLRAAPSCGSLARVAIVENTIGVVELVDRPEPAPVELPRVKHYRRVELPVGKDRIAIPICNVILRPVDDSPGQIAGCLASSAKKLEQVFKACLVPLMGCTTQKKDPSICVHFRQKVTNQSVVLSGIAAAGLPICEMVTFVHYHHVPGTAIQHLLSVRGVHRLVNTRDHQLISQPCIAIGRSPLPKGQVEAGEFPSHISNQSRRREVKHSKTGICREQLLN